MLPDTIHKLSREERFSYARLLAFIARIDNELTVDEMAMLNKGSELRYFHQIKEI